MERRSAFDEAMGTVGTLLFGAAIGAVVALLVTPKSGQELRKDLAREAERVSDRLSETSHELTETVKSKINEFGCCQAEPDAAVPPGETDEQANPA